MVKPQGVWLRTTELGEVTEATVVKSKPQQKPSSQGPGLKVILACSLSLCCCALLSLAAVRYLFPPGPQTTEDLSPVVAVFAQEEDIFPAFGVRVLADGQEYQIESRDQTVAEALGQVGLELSPQDEVSLPLDMLIEADCIISVSRVESFLETVTEEIAPSQKRVEDPALTIGQSVVVEEGEAGLRENTVRITLRDGEEIDRTVVASRVVKEPVSAVVNYGGSLASRSDNSTNSGAAVSVNGEDLNYTQKLSMESTAYTWTGNTTATGTWPAYGTVAVDPRVIPLGTKLYVEGYGYAVAADTGGAIKGSVIDVYFPTREECIQWGRKHGLNVYILE